jgi:hypothetical protein
MQGDLSPLKVSLSRVETCPSQTFDGTVDGLTITRIYSEVDDTVRACADDRDQLEVTIINVLRYSDSGHRGRRAGGKVAGRVRSVLNEGARSLLSASKASL